MGVYKLEQDTRDEAMVLLGKYDEGSSFCFSSPSRTIHSQGPYMDVFLPDASKASKAIEILRGYGRSGSQPLILAGAIPFNIEEKARLVILHDYSVGDPMMSSAPRSGAASQRALSRPSYNYSSGASDDYRESFLRGVRGALEEIDSGRLSKVVLSRTLELGSVRRQHPAKMVRRMLLKHPGSYCSALHLGKQQSAGDKIQEQRIFFGASPELLLSKEGARIVSNPLAGSIPRSSDPQVDRERGEALLCSDKDRWEHAIVVEDIERRLSPWCGFLTVPKQPSLIKTPTMWHLSTRIEGEVKDPSLSSLELAMLIHPTPAVGGQPSLAAREAISRLEPHERGFYGGFVGWCDSEGDGEWAVAIRCGEASAHGVRLYAGAGIISGSDPALEWEETEAKLATMLSVFGLSFQELRRDGVCL